MNFLILLPLLLQLVGLVFAVLVDPYIRRTHRIIIMIIVGIVCCETQEDPKGETEEQEGLEQ